MIKRLAISIFLSLMVFLPRQAYADEFKKIDIEAEISKDGVGHIRERWDIVENDTDYTERYKLINNLRGLKIEDFSLRALGRDFKKMDPWDTDLSFEEKAFRYGRIDRDDEVELCWGISDYSDNSYELSYKISPLAIGLEDADMVFFKFVGDNFDPMPEEVSIKLRAYEPLGEDIKFWAFGLEGQILNKDGIIELKSTGDINYATVMVKFPKGYFNTPYKEDKSFEDYANEAVKGSKWEENEGQAYKPPLPRWAKVLIGVLSALGIGGGFLGIRAAKLSFNEKNLANFKELRTLKDLKDHYYKDIPYEGPVEDLAFLIEKTYLNITDLAGDYINAFILKWAMKGHVILGDRKWGAFSDKKIKVLSKPKNMGEIEGAIFDIFYKTSLRKSDGTVGEADLRNYLKSNKKDLDNFYEDLEEKSIRALKEGGFLEDYEYEKSFLSSTRTGKELRITDKGVDLYERLVGFRNYLKDYEKVRSNDKEEIKKWDEFLVYAVILSQAEGLVDFIGDRSFENNNFIYYPYLYHNSKSYAQTTNQTYANTTGFSNAGFGGMTSVGGGGGSFGGGGGGGR